MHFYRTGVFDGERGAAGSEREETKEDTRARRLASGQLRAVAAVLLTLAATMPPGYAQQNGAGSNGPDKAASELPAAPTPAPTQPFPLRTSNRDFSKPFGVWLGNPINIYRHDGYSQGELREFGAADRSGEGREDLPEPLGRDCAGDREQLRHRDCALRPGHCGHGYSAHQDRRSAAGRAVRPGHGNAGRINFNALNWRRPGRNDGRFRRSGFRSQWTFADHEWRGTDAGEPGSQTVTGTIQFDRNHRHRRTSSPAAPATTNQYNFTFNQGFVTGTNLQVGFEQRVRHHQQRDCGAEPGALLNLQGDVDAAPAAGRRDLGEQAVHLPGAKRPADHRLLVPAADSLHREPGGDASTGVWCRPTKMCKPKSARWIRAINCWPTTRSNWRSAPWRRWTW